MELSYNTRSLQLHVIKNSIFTLRIIFHLKDAISNESVALKYKNLTHSYKITYRKIKFST